MVRFHEQSSTRYAYDERRDFLYPVDRLEHTAIGVRCPTCGVTAGPCISNGAPLPRLKVHMARQEASL